MAKNPGQQGSPGGGSVVLAYDTAKPLEVRLEFQGRRRSGEEVVWVFARDALARRLPGLADVTCRTSGPWLYLALSSVEGKATIRMLFASVSAFLATTKRLIPYGAEVLDFDAELDLLLLAGGDR